MTEPPRPPGDGSPEAVPPDPTAPPPPPGSYSVPGETPSPGYDPPPSAPPPSAPGSGAGQYDAPQYPPQQPGYGAPPPGGAGYPPGTYGAPTGGYPGGGPAPVGYATSEDKTWALVAHFGGALGAVLGGGVGGWIAPLVALLARGNQSPTVRAHAVAALNFQILWSIIALVGYVLICVLIGAAIVPIVIILELIFGIIAGVKANEGVLYRYPMSISMIK